MSPFHIMPNLKIMIPHGTVSGMQQAGFQAFGDGSIVTVQGGKMMVGGSFPSLPPQGERFGVR
jgi:hypothetical protein